MVHKGIKYFSKPELRSRGWTDSMIKRFMPEHDFERINPFFKRASKMKLYLQDKVFKIEETEDFKTALSLGRKRREIYLSVAARKRKEMIDWVTSLKINIPDMDKSDIISRACKEYNEWHLYNDYNDGIRLASPSSDINFLARICTNYLRHKCTSYEKHLNKMFGKVGVKEAHDILQTRINDAIHKKYPWTEEKK